MPLTPYRLTGAASSPTSPPPLSPPVATAAQNRFDRLLQMPLLHKLIAADLAINVAAFLVMCVVQDNMSWLAMVALLLTMLLNALIVQWSLLPLKDLELTATRIASNDWFARVPASPLADRNIARIGRTLNGLLDQLLADQVRVRQLSAQAIGAADEERAYLARELHGSTAQSLSAVEMLMSATLQETSAEGPNAALHARLSVMRDVLAEALRDVRNLSHRMHPSALEHLGLAAALEVLARRTLESAGLETSVHAQVDAAVSPLVASVLYRVAQEAVGNALRHASPRKVSIRLMVDAEHAALAIQDDGQGFEMAHSDGLPSGIGLFVMRERLLLINGRLDVQSQVGQGTTVLATAPNVPGEAP